MVDVVDESVVGGGRVARRSCDADIGVDARKETDGGDQ